MELAGGALPGASDLGRRRPSTDAQYLVVIDPKRRHGIASLECLPQVYRVESEWVDVKSESAMIPISFINIAL